MMSEERAILLRCKTPSERYEQLLKTHPDITQKTTQIIIASYLGIGRETLNRLSVQKLKSDFKHKNGLGQEHH